MNSTLAGAVAMYLAQIRAELSDLPPGELEDVLDDVSGHLTEVATEFEAEPTVEALEERLGTPRQYADELRTAAGYPPRAGQSSDQAGWPALRWGLIAATVGPFLVVIGGISPVFILLGLITLFGAAFLGVRALRGNDPRIVLETAQGQRLAASIRNLVDQIPPNLRHELVSIGQPVWWVARGVVGGGGFFALFGAGAVAVVGALAGAAVSVWIGRRTQQDRRWLWYVVPLNVVATVIVPAWLAFSFVGGSAYGLSGSYNDYRGSSGTNYAHASGLTMNGNRIENIYPFDEQGRQVKVRLYDQDGKPLNVEIRDCVGYWGTDPSGTRPSESNQFPQAMILPDSEGNTSADNCKDSDKALFIPPAAPVSGPPTATTTPTPSAGTSAKPTTTPSAGAPNSPRPSVTLTISPTR
ncbi:putative membrane protein [Kribbella orskensis]|uniref:Membrane protein n=1 Tax=Kribbella orskensis TaxID=2512216 RepID=A0ABY2BAQ8_9ACTN|nr:MULTISPECIES: hypothetical protein [Kribbella]TCN30566.1 putative membrane protein [Kribbella sp. VKM Ac-2500]TCO11299.1 putative membrane protein [Kribbella orskensis]